ncbi:unnamed protein product, partial [Mesorhabditis belari]|uniref:Uncharacterized protein n=1 Tax=Mesorhabditis belari TaxID=2138241 RepID=A0AAF3F5N0_9BILA
MSTTQMNPFNDPLADDPPLDSTRRLTAEQKRIQELELANIEALQAKADLEYCLELAEFQRKRLEEEKAATAFGNAKTTVVSSSTRTTFSNRDRKESLVQKSAPLILKLCLCFGAVILLSIAFGILIRLLIV